MTYLPPSSAIDKKLIGEAFTFLDIRAKSLSDCETLEDARVRAGHSDAKTRINFMRALRTSSPGV